MNEKRRFERAAELYYVECLPLHLAAKAVRVDASLLVRWFHYGSLPAGMTEAERIKTVESCRKRARNLHGIRKTLKSATTPSSPITGTEGPVVPPFPTSYLSKACPSQPRTANGGSPHA